MNKEIKDELKARLKGKVVILGIGNPLKGDDGFGPELVKRLKGRVSAALIDGGTAPESYLEVIANLKPDTIMVVDAVHFDGSPGELRLLSSKDIFSAGLSTHNLSPKVLMDFLNQRCSADVFMLAVQPKLIEFGAEMSGEVKRKVERLEALLSETLKGEV